MPRDLHSLVQESNDHHFVRQNRVDEEVAGLPDTLAVDKRTSATVPKMIEADSQLEGRKLVGMG